MKSYFIRLLNYDCHANLQITELLLPWPNLDKPVALMAHLLAAQQRWLTRCLLQPPPASLLWPKGDPAEFSSMIYKNHAEWSAFLESLEPEDFDQAISYQTTTGEKYADRLVDVLGHLINHGTHHRAQIGQLLKLSGITLPGTDYISYLRQIQ